MKIGIISDVHSNIDALKETFKKINEEKVDKVICLGDVIGIGPYPEKCIDFFINNNDMFISFVKGNHENYLLNGQADIYLFGHTHQKYYLEDNCKYYINPGSMGCPINSKGANAGILEIHNNKIEYKQLEIKYDIKKLLMK